MIVLASATSLSRALARAMAGIWRLPRPRSRLNSAWRWLAVLLALAMSALAARALGRFTDAIPPRPVWTVGVTIGIDVLVATFVPWLLLAGQVRVRRLLPGALVYAIFMLVVRPATAEYMPAALEESAQRYGSIGVAFTYVAWLYVWSFAFLGAAIIGRVIADDPAALGLFIRAGEPVPADAASLDWGR